MSTDCQQSGQLDQGQGGLRDQVDASRAAFRVAEKGEGVCSESEAATVPAPERTETETGSTAEDTKKKDVQIEEGDGRSLGDGASVDGKVTSEQMEPNPVEKAPAAGLPFATAGNGGVKSDQKDKNSVPPTRLYTREEIKPYNGTGEYRQILLGINGKVFDVTGGRQFYGPGGAYSMFAGRDATRALCMFEINPSDDPVDLKTLTPLERESLENWEKFYMEKYIWIGVLETPKLAKPLAGVNDKKTQKDSRSCTCRIL